MTHIANPVTLTAELYQARDAAKQYLGAEYRQHMETLADSLLKSTKTESKNILDAAIAACKVLNLTGWQAVCTLAAAVEVLEPSKEEACE
jgi:hypothetical protein